jgi:hypothetical protein
MQPLDKVMHANETDEEVLFAVKGMRKHYCAVIGLVHYDVNDDPNDQASLPAAADVASVHPSPTLWRTYPYYVVCRDGRHQTPSFLRWWWPAGRRRAPRFHHQDQEVLYAVAGVRKHLCKVTHMKHYDVDKM